MSVAAEDIFLSKNGMKIIIALLFIQPATRMELKHFLPFLYVSFKEKNKPFPSKEEVKKEIENEFGEAIKKVKKKKFTFENNFANFKHKYLYGPDSTLEKAVNSKLVVKVPRKKGSKESYYFLNSDLIFHLELGSKFSITPVKNIEYYKTKENEKVSIIPYEIKLSNEEILRLNLLKEWKQKIIIESMGSFNIFNFLYYLRFAIKYPAYMQSMWLSQFDNKGLRIPFRGEKRQDLFKKGIIVRNGITKEKYITEPFRVSENVYFRFNPSYEILKCFSNSDDINYNLSPMKNLKLLTRKKYKILPEKRKKIFTCIEIIKETTPYNVKTSIGHTKMGSYVFTELYSNICLFSDLVYNFDLFYRKSKKVKGSSQVKIYPYPISLFYNKLLKLEGKLLG